MNEQPHPNAVETTLGFLAELVGGQLVGDKDLKIRGAQGLAEAGPQDLSFVAGERWRALARSSKACALVADEAPDGFSGGLILHKDPNLAFAQIVAHLLRRRAASKPGIHKTAYVHESADVDALACIHALAVVEARAKIGAGSIIASHVTIGEDVVIGRDCQIHPGVRIQSGCRLGDRVILQPNAVIGGDGFGFATDPAGRHVKIPHTGTVILEDDVEVGACTTIDRARFAATRIGRGTKIDNLVMLAHNVQVGGDSLIVAQAGVAGSTQLGQRVVLGGHVGVAGHITIGDDAKVAAFSGVSGNLEAAQSYFGIPAIPLAEGRRAAVLHTRLPKLWERIKRLEERLLRLEPGEGGPNA